MKKAYISALKAYKATRELEMLLTMLTPYSSTQSYIDALSKGFNVSLVDVVLFCVFSHIEITVYYLSQEGLAKTQSKFGFKADTVRLFMTESGHFDTVYNKGYVRIAGICQSIVLGVILSSNLLKLYFDLDSGTRRSKAHDIPELRVHAVEGGGERGKYQARRI